MLSVYNDIAWSTISLRICLFCAIFSCSFICTVLKTQTFLFFTNVLNSTFEIFFYLFDPDKENETEGRGIEGKGEEEEERKKER